MSDYPQPDPTPPPLPVFNTVNWPQVEMQQGGGGGGAGFQGTQGLQGFGIGSTGAIGPQGLRGFQGSQGNDGVQGLVGPTGAGGGGSSNTFFYAPGATSIVSIAFNDTVDAYYEVYTSFYQTGSAGTTGTIRLSYQGVDYDATNITQPGYGSIKVHINNSVTDVNSKLEFELSSVTAQGTFITPNNVRYGWITANQFPKTLGISSTSSFTIFYYTIVTKFK